MTRRIPQCQGTALRPDYLRQIHNSGRATVFEILTPCSKKVRQAT